MRKHDFADRLNFSEGIEPQQELFDHLMAIIPASEEIVKATINEDRSGTDFWVTRKHGLPPVSVDFKHRSFCPIERFGSDDVCIETCSVYSDGMRKRIGWTLDEKKRTDLIVYTWPNQTGRRFWILYFPILCAAARKHWKDWASEFKERPAINNGYETLSVYAPRARVAMAMKNLVASETA